MPVVEAVAGGGLINLVAQLRRAAEASRAAEYRRMAQVISAAADEIERLTPASASRSVVESAIARAQHTLDVWQALSSF